MVRLLEICKEKKRQLELNRMQPQEQELFYTELNYRHGRICNRRF
jgi:hypothetical protein